MSTATTQSTESPTVPALKAAESARAETAPARLQSQDIYRMTVDEY
jgi:hypothetical protein